MDGEVIEKSEDKKRYSYSRLSCFEHCPYEYYLNYVLTDEDRDDLGYISEGNYYAENGSLVHDIHEQYFNGEIKLEDLSEIYYNRYESEICYEVKKTIMDNTFNACANYFATTEFDWMSEYDVVGVEIEVKLTICGYAFIGYIDLLLRHKKTGEFWLVDHKSSPYPLKKDGGVLAKSKESFASYKKQMYLYCHAIKEKYGKFPKKITWNHFKEQKLATIDFNEDEYNEAINWFENTVKKTELEEDFEARTDFFYCNNLCNYRSSCEYKRYKDE